MVFDYIDGGADDEITLAHNEARFRAIGLLPRALIDVEKIDIRTTLMSTPLATPIIIAPTASTRLFNPRAGEEAVARAAHSHGTFYSASTLASTTIEEIAATTPGPKLFQIYAWKDRGLILEILARARDTGFKGIILTVDTPVAGNRERDFRNDFSIPPKITWSTATQALGRPGYMFDLAVTPKISAANFTHLRKDVGGIVDFINEQFDRTVSWRDACWLRENWDGAFAIKGISHGSDAVRCVEIGADAVWVSNHGGRQLDTAPATIDLVAEIADVAAGRAEIVMDGGVRRGSDVVKAIALGACAVAIGRPYLWGLAAHGEQGVLRAFEILESELRRTMALIGCPMLADLTPEILRPLLPPR